MQLRQHAQSLRTGPGAVPRMPCPAAVGRLALDVIEAPGVTSALEQARTLAGSTGLVVVTGSIYIVGEALRALSLRP